MTKRTINDCNYAQILDNTHQIINTLNNSNNGMADHNYILNILPKVIMIGPQSSGKSSLCNRMFNLHNKVNQGIGTKFPIQYIFGQTMPDIMNLYVKGVPYEGYNNLDISTKDKYQQHIQDIEQKGGEVCDCLLYTSDAADDM
jgi:predicted GTPase